MAHHASFIATIVVGLCLAFIFGAIANRLRIPLLVGYLLAGVAVGPYTPGFVGNQAFAAPLAEIGVILLMFGVGLHFSPKDLLQVRKVALPGAVLQVMVSTLLGMGIGLLLGWPTIAAFVFGLALSVASTVVLMRAMQDRHLLDTERGRVAVGWLVVQDLLMVIALILLPPLAALFGTGAANGPRVDPGTFALTLAVTLGKVAAFIALMLLVGRRVVPMVLHYVAHTGSRELFRLAVALGVAYAASELFSVSFALGAFFAGMILSESELSQRAAEESLPLRDAFAALFFLSVGMLFDPAVIVREPLPLLGTLMVVVVGNAGIAWIIVRGLGHPVGTALTVGVGLAQIGEFSFILAALGVALGILPDRGRDLILGASIISILANPIVFALKERLRLRLEGGAEIGGATLPPAGEPELSLPISSLAGHAVLVGHGRVGRILCEGLLNQGWQVLVVEEATDAVENLRSRGIEAIVGNGAQALVLNAANVAEAKLLLVAIPNAFEAGQIVQQARKANAGLRIIARAGLEAEAEHLLQLGAEAAITGEPQIARAMLEKTPDAPIATGAS